jgi:hypothetical protein
MHSKVGMSGSGRSEFSTEEIAVVEDLREQRLALEVRSVVQLMIIPKMDNGMKSDVQNQSEVIKLFSKLQEEIISQSQESKSTQLNAQVMAVAVCHK